MPSFPRSCVPHNSNRSVPHNQISDRAGDQHLDDSREDRRRRLLRRVSKSGKVQGDGLSDWAVWSVVEQAAKEIGIERFGAHDLRRTCAKLCRRPAATWSRSSFCWAIRRYRRPSAISARNRILRQL